MKVFKYTLDIVDGPQIVRTPRGAKIVFIDQQHSLPRIWIEINEHEEKIDRAFHVIRTGYEIPKQSLHRGSFQMSPFTWHIYETKI